MQQRVSASNAAWSSAISAMSRPARASTLASLSLLTASQFLLCVTDHMTLRACDTRILVPRGNVSQHPRLLLRIMHIWLKNAKRLPTCAAAEMAVQVFSPLAYQGSIRKIWYRCHLPAEGFSCAIENLIRRGRVIAIGYTLCSRASARPKLN